MKRFSSILVLLICALFATSIFAQSSGQQRPNGASGEIPDMGVIGVVMGMIVSSEKTPMQYATIYVLNSKDSAIVTGGLTNEKGYILVKDIPYGSYIIEISALGYQKHYTPSFTLTESNKRYNLKQFVLTKKATRIGEVEISSQKEMLEQNLDKKTYNVENNVIADGATAVEVLTDIPSVDVDLDGAVSLRGSSNVRILIDGRPTNMTLDQIPASQIQSIEVITNPSARYEPDGMSGIINVVLKKGRESGMNALVSLGTAINVFQDKVYFENRNANLNFNYHVGKVNFYLNYSHGRYGWHRAGSMDQQTWKRQDTTLLNNQDSYDNISLRNSLKTTLDYQINSKNLLSFGVGFNQYKSRDTNNIVSQNYDLFFGERIPIFNSIQNGGGNRLSNNYDANISYKFTSEAKKGRELTADLFYTQMMGKSNSNYLEEFEYPESAPDYFQSTKTSTINQTATGQVDYVSPIGNGGRLETGYKFSFRTIGQDYALFYGNSSTDFIEDITQSNNFEFREFINAAYAIYSNTFFKKLKVQVGLRGEAANTFSDLKSADTVYQKSYYNLFPTVHLRYDINEKNQIQLSYSRRVTRPSFWNLNPFVDLSNKSNLRMGNPNLGPEFADNIELGYSTFLKNASFTFTGFYRIRTNLISRYMETMEATISDGLIYYDLNDGRILTTPVVAGYDSLSTFPYFLTTTRNINSSHNFGLELVYTQKLFDFWRFNLSGDFYRVLINSEEIIDPNLRKDWAYGVRFNQTFKLPKNWDLQLNFRFRSRSITTGSMGHYGGGIGQGRRNATYSLNLGVKKGFFNNNFTVSLNIRDLIYNPMNIIESFNYDNPLNGYDAITKRWRSAFQANLTLTYKFNNYKERREKPRGVDSIEPSME